MAAPPQPLTRANVLTVLEALLAHGWGEVRMVVKDHQVVTVVIECTVKTSEQVAEFPFLCYRQSV